MVKKSNYIQAFFLGKMDYLSAMNLQERINNMVFSNKFLQTILFLEHDNVLTYGSGEKISENDLNLLNQKNIYLSRILISNGRNGYRIVFWACIFLR